MAFIAPAPQSDNPKVAELANALIIVEPLEYKAEIITVHGPSDAVSARVSNLDTGDVHNDMLFFNIALKGAFKNYIGQQLLGRIVQGTAKTPGKSAPWIFQDASTNAADVAKAEAFLAGGTSSAASSTPSVAAPAAASATAYSPEIQAMIASGSITAEQANLLAGLGAKPA